MSFSHRLIRSKDLYFWRILLIDDDEDDYVLVRQMFSEAREGKFTIEWASTFAAGKQMLGADRTFDAVIVDYDIGAHTGTEIIRDAVAEGYPAPLLLLTGRGTYEIDVEAMQAGAADYLSKGEMNAVFLERAVRYAIERKKNEVALRTSEKNLRESEQRFRALFENRHSMMWLVDPETMQIVDANEAACAFYGLSRAELVGMKVTEINTLPLDQTQARLSQAQASTTSVRFHFQHQLTNGDVRDVEVRTGPIKIGDQQLLFSIIDDITEHIQTQQALCEALKQTAWMAREGCDSEQMAEIMAAMRWVRQEKQKLQKELQFQVDGVLDHYILTLEPIVDE